MKLNLAAVLVATLLVSCDSPRSQSKRPEEPQTAEEFLGQRALEILRAPTKVQPFRINSNHSDKQDDVKRIDGYVLISAAPDRDEVFARRIADIFLNSDTYSFNSAKGCIFDPGVVFRVFKGDAYIDLILCFHCREFELIVFDDHGKPVDRAGEDFDKADTALMKLAQEAFPEDAEIQKLK